MKKYIIIVSIIILAFFCADYVYYHTSFYIVPFTNEQIECNFKTQDKDILIKKDENFEKFTVKGVDLSSGIPGHHSSDYKIDKKTYSEWIEKIHEMGANTIRIYSVLDSDFYEALYEYNTQSETPIYILQGVWCNDYMHNSHRDAFSYEFVEEFKNNCRITVDVIHGRRKINLGRGASHATGSYLYDVSPWVIGYILGVDWTDTTVAYTDEKYKLDNLSHNGEYIKTTPEATPFEVMLAGVGEATVEYETKKYKTQRLVSFSNYPQTDPFYYPEDVEKLYGKCARIDTENIVKTDKLKSGIFASYHVYPYQTHILKFVEDFNEVGTAKVTPFYDEENVLDTYKTYINMLTQHHKTPVVISEFGISTQRGSAYEYVGKQSEYYFCSEKEQGMIISELWDDITSVGCAGGCIFEWQDEWHRHTMNTLYAVNREQAQFWSDFQTGGQGFGILTFDPGKVESVCYVDGEVDEWKDEDLVVNNGSLSLFSKYDEKFIYFMINKKDFDFSNEKIYIPIDVTQKSGSNYCQNYDLKFDREADFVVVIDGENESRVVVNERYESLRSTYSLSVHGYDTYIKENIPEKDSPLFVDIKLLTESKRMLENPYQKYPRDTVETGKLQFGNANPKDFEFNSLADFYVNGDYVEIRLPWQLLNFSDPSQMKIHSDYYDGNYGVDDMRIKKIYAGVGADNKRMSLGKINLKGWGNNPTYHERLKGSYYIIKNLWR